MARRASIAPGGDPQQHPALTGGHVVILSGEKPIFKQNMQGPQGHAALGQLLEQKGLEYEPTSGKYAGELQSGYITYPRNDDEDETLKDIAKRMGQESVVHSEQGQHQLVYVGGPDEGKATQPSAGVNNYGSQPDDNYSVIYGAGGEPLHYFSYNIDFEHPLIQHGPSQMVDAPEAARMVLKSAVEAYRGILLDLRKREIEKADKFAPGIAVAPGVKVKSSVAQALAGMKSRKPVTKPGVAPKSGNQTKPTSSDDPWDAFERRGGRSQVLPTKKYEVESKKTITHGPKPVSDDISAQGFAGRPTNPNNHLTTGGGPISHVQPGGHNGAVTKKSEDLVNLHDLLKSQASIAKMEPLEKPPVSEAQRRAMHAAASGNSTLGIPKSVGKDFSDADKGGRLPKTKKAEYHPTPSYQASRDVSKPHSDESSLAPNRPSHPFSDPARSTTGGSMSNPIVKSEAELAKGLRSTVAGAMAAGTMALAPGAASAVHTPALGGSIVHTSSSAHKKPSAHIIYMAPPPGRGAAGTDFKNSSVRTDKGPMLPDPRPPMPVIKNSIFKKMPEMNKGEVRASGGTIKLGKQEFYIDLGNASDPKKRLRETNPVKEAVVPGGKETGWKTDGPKPKTVEHSASGGTISKNPPKAGPDQKNTAENSITEGSPGKKAAPKNDLIAKAAMSYHARMSKAEGGDSHPYCGKCGKKLRAPAKTSSFCPSCESEEEEGEDAGMVTGTKYYNSKTGMKKAMPSMAAPKPPQAPGAGSPTLSAKPSVKPPTAPPGGKPMGGFGKALMPFSAQKEAADKAPHGMAPGAGGQGGPERKPQVKSPSEYDPSLYQPSGPVSSGLELAGPPIAPPGTGVTPRPAAPIRSPAVHRGIRGFLGLGKGESSTAGEVCKMCKKAKHEGECC